MQPGHVAQRAAVAVALSAIILAVAPKRESPAQRQAGRAVPDDSIRIPESLKKEHREIHDALERATRARGPVGVAARELAAVLHPHFVREEQIALPPLGLLAPLARGEGRREMRDVLPLTDSLRAELPRMLREHVAIRAATTKMGQAARAAGNHEVERLAEELALHARTEEEVTYPAAILVGELVRARTANLVVR